MIGAAMHQKKNFMILFSFESLSFMLLQHVCGTLPADF